MSKTQTAEREMFTPIESFATELDGVPQVFKPLLDRFDGSHPLVVANPGLFRVLTVNHEWEAATAAPGEKRG